MRQIKATRKIKEQLSAYFMNGGSLENRPTHLQGVDVAVVKDCWDYAQRKLRQKESRVCFGK